MLQELLRLPHAGNAQLYTAAELCDLGRGLRYPSASILVIIIADVLSLLLLLLYFIISNFYFYCLLVLASKRARSGNSRTESGPVIRVSIRFGNLRLRK